MRNTILLALSLLSVGCAGQVVSAPPTAPLAPKTVPVETPRDVWSMGAETPTQSFATRHVGTRRASR